MSIISCDSNTDNADIPDIGAATDSSFVALRVEAEYFTSVTGGWTHTNQYQDTYINPLGFARGYLVVYSKSHVQSYQGRQFASDSNDG